MATPTCFISYAWDSDAHKDWVRDFASALCDNGVDTKLDQWDVRPGMDLTTYMETCVRESDFVLLICTPIFAQKANAGKGGVGYEKAIVTGEIFQGSATSTKFVPVLRLGDAQDSLPAYLKSRAYLDFRDDASFQSNLEQLLRHVYASPLYTRPSLGPKPTFSGPTYARSAPSVVTPPSPTPHVPKRKWLMPVSVVVMLALIVFIVWRFLVWAMTMPISPSIAGSVLATPTAVVTTPVGMIDSTVTPKPPMPTTLLPSVNTLIATTTPLPDAALTPTSTFSPSPTILPGTATPTLSTPSSTPTLSPSPTLTVHAPSFVTLHLKDTFYFSVMTPRGALGGRVDSNRDILIAIFETRPDTANVKLLVAVKALDFQGDSIYTGSEAVRLFSSVDATAIGIQLVRHYPDIVSPVPAQYVGVNGVDGSLVDIILEGWVATRSMPALFP